MMSEAGVSYADALAEAQRLGYAERDPSADVDGHDAASKAAILAALAFRCDVVADDVPREGITTVDPVDIAFADRLGYVVKLLAVIERTGGSEGLAGGRWRARDLGTRPPRHAASDPSPGRGARGVQRRVRRGRQCRRAHALRPRCGREAHRVGGARRRHRRRASPAHRCAGAQRGARCGRHSGPPTTSAVPGT